MQTVFEVQRQGAAFAFQPEVERLRVLQRGRCYLFLQGFEFLFVAGRKLIVEADELPGEYAEFRQLVLSEGFRGEDRGADEKAKPGGESL